MMIPQQSLQPTGIQFKVAEEKDWEDIVQFQQKHYPRHGWSMDYLKWEYGLNPSGKPQVWIAKNHNELVASFAAVPHKVLFRGAARLGWRMEHLLIREDYRNLGIYQMLMAASRKFLKPKLDKSYAYAFPNEKSFPGFQAAGWSVAAKIPLYTLSLQGANLRREFQSISAKTIERFEASVSEIWKSYVQNFDCAVERNSEYLNWRYFMSPSSRYQIVELAQKEQRAYLVLKMYQSREGENQAHICDYFQNASNPTLGEAALEYAIHFAKDKGCSILSLWCTDHNPLRKSLEPLGFLPDSQLNRYLVACSSDKTALKENIRWQISMGDSDVF